MGQPLGSQINSSKQRQVPTASCQVSSDARSFTHPFPGLVVAVKFPFLRMAQTIPVTVSPRLEADAISLWGAHLPSRAFTVRPAMAVGGRGADFRRGDGGMHLKTVPSRYGTKHKPGEVRKAWPSLPASPGDTGSGQPHSPLESTRTRFRGPRMAIREPVRGGACNTLETPAKGSKPERAALVLTARASRGIKRWLTGKEFRVWGWADRREKLPWEAASPSSTNTGTPAQQGPLPLHTALPGYQVCLPSHCGSPPPRAPPHTLPLLVTQSPDPSAMPPPAWPAGLQQPTWAPVSRAPSLTQHSVRDTETPNRGCLKVLETGCWRVPGFCTTELRSDLGQGPEPHLPHL